VRCRKRWLFSSQLTLPLGRLWRCVPSSHGVAMGRAAGAPAAGARDRFLPARRRAPGLCKGARRAPPVRPAAGPARGSGSAAASVRRAQGDKVVLKVNKLTSIRTQLPYEYYSMPYCRPERIMPSAENLGEVLRGDRIENSPYEARPPPARPAAAALPGCMKPLPRRARACAGR